MSEASKQWRRRRRIDYLRRTPKVSVVRRGTDERRIDRGVAMTLFEGLLAAHLLGDWLLQTEWQAQNKTHNWRALLTHIVIYHAVVLAVVVFGFGLNNMIAYGVVALLAVSHAILDRRHFEIWLMRTLRLTVERPPEKWLVIAVDQSIHLLILAGAALALTRFSVH